MNQALKKAYSVQGDEHGVVVFAGHSVVARREGANELNEEFGGVTCKRAPEFDEYAAAGKVPVKAMLAAGWWWECQSCGRHVYEDDCCIHDDVAYCCEACRDKELADRVVSERREQAFADCVHEKWPGVTVQHVHEFRGDGEATFTFPGGMGMARWVSQENALYVPLSDHPAWAEFTGRPVEIIERRSPF